MKIIESRHKIETLESQRGQAIQSFNKYADDFTDRALLEMIETDEDISIEPEKKYIRYTINLEAWPTDDFSAASIRVRDLPLSARKQLADAIINYPDDKIKVFAELDESSNED